MTRSEDSDAPAVHRRASSEKVIIVGAGLGGLTAALSLLKRGVDVEVYEQSSHLREVGAGIQLGANGTRVLYALGLKDALAQSQVIPERRELRHWSTGETWNWFELGAASVQRYGTPHIMLHRGDLHGVLADAVRSRHHRPFTVLPETSAAVLSAVRPVPPPKRAAQPRGSSEEGDGRAAAVIGS